MGGDSRRLPCSFSLRARAVEAQPAGHAIHTVGVLILHSRQAVGYTAFVDTCG